MSKSSYYIFEKINKLIFANELIKALSMANEKLNGITDAELKTKLEKKIEYIRHKLATNRSSAINNADASRCTENFNFDSCRKFIKSDGNTSQDSKVLCTIVNYNENLNSLDLQSKFMDHFDTVVLDSGSNDPHADFIKLGNVFYGGLLDAAYRIALEGSYDAIFFICSDVKVDSVNANLLIKSIKSLSFTEIGVYAPSSTGRSHPFCKSDGTNKFSSVPFVEGFIFVASLDILSEFLPSSVKYGWGLDVAKGFYARKLDKLVVIDNSVSVFHPPGTGYSNENAKNEMLLYFEKNNDDCFRDYTRNSIEPFIKYWAENKKVSVIIPCYNQGHYLKFAVYSVLSQYYNNVEIIIIDDGSTDSTESVSISLMQKFSQIKYLKKKNGGLSSSRNAGLKIASGDYIQFLDADDFISKNKIYSQLLLLENSGADICVSNYHCFKDDSPGSFYKYSREEFIGDPLSDLITNWEHDLSIPMHCFLYKMSSIKDIYFNEELPNHEDWDFHLRIAERDLKYVNDKNSYAYYRVRSDSMSRDKLLMNYGIELTMLYALIRYRDKKINYDLMKKRLIDFRECNGI